MRHKLLLAIGCMWLVAAPFASAQWFPRGPLGGGGNLIGRVRGDLGRARSYRRVDGHERGHFEQAERDLDRFQVNWSRGKFDKDRLDGAIGHIQHLVNSDQVNPRDRRILSEDLYALREFRANRGYGGGPWRR